MRACAPPAVHHHGSGVGGVAGLDSPEEGQDGGGVLRHAVVGPRHELELPHLSLFTGAVLWWGGGEGGGKTTIALRSCRVGVDSTAKCTHQRRRNREGRMTFTFYM